MIKKLTIDPVNNTTSWEFEIIKIYDDEYRKLHNKNEAPQNKWYLN